MTENAKEIRRFKIAINSGCPLRCDYCFIDKDANEVLPAEAAESAVELALSSPGREKKLLIYGGEPFLHFPLLKRVILYARRREKALGKELAISVATSGILASQEQLAFLEEQQSQLAISIDGAKRSHDRFRVMKGGKGSFDQISRNVALALKVMPKRSVIALLGTHPEEAEAFFENFKYVVSLGFENVNIEVIHGFPWTPRALGGFSEGLERMGEYLLASLDSEKPVYLESAYKDFRKKTGSEAEMCPFYSYLEVYPSGDYSFYPFPFVAGLQERPAVLVGDVKEGFFPRYRDCSFKPDALLCRGCLTEYYKVSRVAMGSDAFGLRTRASRRFAEAAERVHGGTPVYDGYVREVAMRDRLGFSE